MNGNVVLAVVLALAFPAHRPEPMAAEPSRLHLPAYLREHHDYVFCLQDDGAVSSCLRLPGATMEREVGFVPSTVAEGHPGHSWVSATKTPDVRSDLVMGRHVPLNYLHTRLMTNDPLADVAKTLHPAHSRRH